VAVRLRQALERRGWTALPDQDGNLVYRMPVPPSPAVDVSPVETAAPAAQLRAELEGRGWRAVPAEDGSVYYLPPQHAATAGPTISDRLKAALEQQGWIAVSAQDGCLIYRMPVSDTAGVAQSGTTEAEPPVDASDAADSAHSEGQAPAPEPGPDANTSASADQGAQRAALDPAEATAFNRPWQSGYPSRAWAPPPGSFGQPMAPAPRPGAPNWAPGMGWRQSPWAAPQPGPYYRYR
jgi:hypothetical protein